MTPYRTEQFINSILKNSFHQKHYIDKTQLNRIAYQTAKEIFIQTGEKVVQETFTVSYFTPALSSVNVYYLQIHDGRTIREYMKNNSERAEFINDEKINSIILQVWNRTKCMPLSVMLSELPTSNNTFSNYDDQLLLAG